MPSFSVQVTYPPRHATKPITKVIRVQAKAVTEAVEEALRQLQVTLDQVIRVVAKADTTVDGE